MRRQSWTAPFPSSRFWRLTRRNATVPFGLSLFGPFFSSWRLPPLSCGRRTARCRRTSTWHRRTCKREWLREGGLQSVDTKSLCHNGRPNAQDRLGRPCHNITPRRHCGRGQYKSSSHSSCNQTATNRPVLARCWPWRRRSADRCCAPSPRFPAAGAQRRESPG
jgi:hypothetical protein